MSPAYHIAQARKPVPLAALSQWLHIVAHGHMANGCRVLAARDPLAAVIHWLPWLPRAMRIEAPGRADGDRATLTEASRTIYFFFQITQVANGFYLPVLQSFSSLC
jgi:hypothetical protein